MFYLYTGPAATYGCMDSNADNYNPDSQFDDGSCEIPGCIWNYWFICPSSINLDATIGDWAYCEYIWGGCPSALGLPNGNYPVINLSEIPGDHADLSLYVGEDRLGCMDKKANNFSPNVVVDDGSCFYLDSVITELDGVIVYPQPTKERIFVQCSKNQNIQKACPLRNCFFYDRHRTVLAFPEDNWKYLAAGEKLYCSCSQPPVTYVGLVVLPASFCAEFDHFCATHFY